MSRESDLKLPPHNIEAEMGVLGSVLLDNDTLDEVVPILRPEDFYRDTLASVYRAIRDMHDRRQRIDVITLIDELTRLGIFEKVGGDDAIRDIMQAPPHAANARYYAQIVAQKAVSRNLIEMANRSIRDGYSNQYSADELIGRCEKDLAAIVDGRFSREPNTIGEAARDSLRRFDLRLDGEIAGITSGLHDLDEITGGFRPDQLIVVGARPGMGKTALGLGIAEYAASMYGPVLFFSLEMGMGELGDRAICGMGQVDNVQYREAQRLRHKREEFARIAERLEKLPVFIDDTPGVTPSQVVAISRRMKRKHGIRMVLVDYIQIMGADDRKDSEYDRVGKAATALKNLSKQISAPVITLSQLSRKCEERPDKRPIMSDLRATGQIEQDADIILFLYRDEKYNPGSAPGQAEIGVAKNRDGATGTATVAFHAKMTKFDNLIPDFGEPPAF